MATGKPATPPAVVLHLAQTVWDYSMCLPERLGTGMAFIGAINDKLRKYFFTQAPYLEGKKCYVGCSGNFTIEQLISRRCERAEIYSNDVSLYSSVIGYALTGRLLKAEFVSEELRWANEYYSRGPVESVATVLLLLEMLKFEKRNSVFAERMWSHYLSAWESMFEATRVKTEKALATISIREYATVDVHDYFPRPDGVSIGFLPTYVGGYEKLFQRLEESVSWDVPDYGLLTDERREDAVNRMTAGEFILYDDRERDLPCVAQVELFGKKTVYIYSNLGMKHGLFKRRLNEKVLPYSLLMPDAEVPDGPVTVQPTEGTVVNHYRNLFLSKKIQPAAGDPNLLVFVDGKLFGFLIFQAYNTRGTNPADRGIYLLSDFVVPSMRHRRLAKLLLMVARCAEVKQFLEEKLIRRIDYMLTTAFTDRPVSMKYRGVFQLEKRGEGFLNYRAEFNDMSIQEVVGAWKKKYGKQ